MPRAAAKRPPLRDTAARNALAEKWSGLPRHVVNKMRRQLAAAGLDPEDAEAEGWLGLLRAAEIWDAARGVKFCTYAHRAVWSRVHRACRQAYLVAVPQWALRAGREPMRRAGPFGHSVHSGGPEGAFYGEHEPHSREPAPDERAERADQLAALRRALARLPYRHRRALELRRLGGLTLAQAGRRVGVTKEAVRQAEARGLARLRERLRRG